jgi:ankyrin repeat protein
LCNIDEEYSQDAFKILQWLAYSARPLRIEEVAEVVAVEIDDSPRFHPENRLLEPRDVLTICSALVTAATRTMQCRLSSNTYEAVELRLAHYSVKEFLLSDRVKTGPASRFCIWKYAEPRIAQTCLAYLLHFERPIPWGLDSVDKFKFPLALYAAEYWPHHARAAGNDMHVINQLCMQLLQAGSNVYMNWIRLFDPDWRYSDRTDNTETMAAPLYYSSLIGLAEPTRLLLELGADVNIQGARYGNALQAASVNGHVTIVRQLVNSGADVNAQAGYWDKTPLAAASYNGHNTIVDYLIESGANVDSHSKKSWTALEAASAGGHETIVQRLLKIGASSGNALTAAARAGHDVIIQLLLKSGAHVGNRKSVNEALRTASGGGHYTICQQLIIAGADVNAPGGELGNALQAAASGGEDCIVKLLLEAGAEIDSSTGEEFYGEPWEVWGTAGRPDEVQYYSPGPNSGAGYFGTALQAAAYGGNGSTVRLLLTSGANCDIQGGWYNNALHAAAAQGHNAIVQQLLESGADVNIQGGYYGNALQAAAGSGHEAMVRLLLENGANVNAKGGVHGNALPGGFSGRARGGC